MLFFRLSPHYTRNGARIFYGYSTPTHYSHSSRSVLTDRHTIFNFLKTVAAYSLLSVLLSCASRLSPILLHLQARHARPAILVAVAPLSVLESDTKLILLFGIQKYI